MFLNIFESLTCPPRLHLFDQKQSNIDKYYYYLK